MVQGKAQGWGGRRGVRGVSSVTVIAGLLLSAVVALAAGNWRAATATELKKAIPARVQVGHEKIETEARTASAVTDGQGHYLLGVALITTGYAAHGKYSHYLQLDAAITAAGTQISAGQYVLGSHRVSQGALDLTISKAADEAKVMTTQLKLGHPKQVTSIHLEVAAGGNGTLYLGRFALPFTID